jgi:RimJ/RimL family protein N-acetyltransferase
MIVHGDDLTQWAQDRMPGRIGFDNPLSIGIIKESRLVGVVVYDNYRPAIKSISVSIVLESKVALTRELLSYLFDHPFNRLGCKRIQAMIDEQNYPSIKLCRQLGFTQEGALRKASPIEGHNLLIFGMLKEECKWLNGKIT